MIKKLDKLPKRKVTVDELIHADDIVDLLQGIYENRTKIDQFVLIYTDDDAQSHQYWHGTTERLLYCLEQMKLKLLGVYDDTEAE